MFVFGMAFSWQRDNEEKGLVTWCIGCWWRGSQTPWGHGRQWCRRHPGLCWLHENYDYSSQSDTDRWGDLSGGHGPQRNESSSNVCSCQVFLQASMSSFKSWFCLAGWLELCWLIARPDLSVPFSSVEDPFVLLWKMTYLHWWWWMWTAEK